MFCRAEWGLLAELAQWVFRPRMSAASTTPGGGGPPPAKKARKKIPETKLSNPDRQLCQLFWEGCVERLERKNCTPLTSGGLGRLTWIILTVRHALSPTSPRPPTHHPCSLSQQYVDMLALQGDPTRDKTLNATTVYHWIHEEGMVAFDDDSAYGKGGNSAIECALARPRRPLPLPPLPSPLPR